MPWSAGATTAPASSTAPSTRCASPAPRSSPTSTRRPWRTVLSRPRSSSIRRCASAIGVRTIIPAAIPVRVTLIAGHHPFDQRHSGQAVDRAGRRQSQARPRQDHSDRAQFRHPHAAARHALAADRRRRGDVARTRRRLCHVPQSRQGRHPARRARSAHRHRPIGVALRPRRQEAGTGDQSASRRST